MTFWFTGWMISKKDEVFEGLALDTEEEETSKLACLCMYVSGCFVSVSKQKSRKREEGWQTHMADRGYWWGADSLPGYLCPQHPLRLMSSISYWQLTRQNVRTNREYRTPDIFPIISTKKLADRPIYAFIPNLKTKTNTALYNEGKYPPQINGYNC